MIALVPVPEETTSFIMSGEHKRTAILQNAPRLLIVARIDNDAAVLGNNGREGDGFHIHAAVGNAGICGRHFKRSDSRWCLSASPGPSTLIREGSTPSRWRYFATEFGGHNVEQNPCGDNVERGCDASRRTGKSQSLLQRREPIFGYPVSPP